MLVLFPMPRGFTVVFNSWGSIDTLIENQVQIKLSQRWSVFLESIGTLISTTTEVLGYFSTYAAAFIFGSGAHSGFSLNPIILLPELPTWLPSYLTWILFMIRISGTSFKLHQLLFKMCLSN